MSYSNTDGSALSLQEKEGKRGKNWQRKTLHEDKPRNTAVNGERNTREKCDFGFYIPVEIKPSDDSDGDQDTSDWKRMRTKDDSTSHHFKVPYRDCSTSSRCSSNASRDSPQRKRHPRRPFEIETDPVILARRQKQIDYGKNTAGYDLYCKAVPKAERKRSHPRTPPKHTKFSRRGWDTMVKIWRQQLHSWDNTERDKIEELTVSPEEYSSNSANNSAAKC